VRPMTVVRSRMIPLLRDNIDTDQIMPARFLRTTHKEGLQEHLFHDWRYDRDGNPRAGFILNDDSTAGASILLTGSNFGCGSSREHAAWALDQSGIRVIISTSFADIFRQNSLKNGLLPVEVSADVHGRLCDLVRKDARADVTVDIARACLELPSGHSIPFPLDTDTQKRLLEGMDDVEFGLGKEAEITLWESRHPQPFDTRAMAGPV